MPTIGVLSDTHGLLRPEAVEALEGSDLILHAGDVGSMEIIEELERIAPVSAVRGNTDHGDTARALPATQIVDLSAPGGRIPDTPGREPPGPLAYVLHIREELDLDPAATGIRVVVYGHTHRPAVEERGGILYFNPGAAGHRRFTLPVTVGRLTVDADRVEAEIVEL